MNKLIEELTALETKATPGPWSTWSRVERDNLICASATGTHAAAQSEFAGNAALIVTMRNALPKLLHYAKIGSEPCEDCSSLKANLQDATDFINSVLKLLRKMFPDIEPDEYGEYWVESFSDAYNAFLKERDTALARAEKTEAERDVLAYWTGRYSNNSKEYWLEIAAQEVAKRGEEA